MRMGKKNAVKILCALLCLAIFAAGVPCAAFAKVVSKAPGAADVSPQIIAQAQADQARLADMRAGDKPAGYWTGILLVSAALLILILVGNGK